MILPYLRESPGCKRPVSWYVWVPTSAPSFITMTPRGMSSQFSPPTDLLVCCIEPEGVNDRVNPQRGTFPFFWTNSWPLPYRVTMRCRRTSSSRPGSLILDPWCWHWTHPQDFPPWWTCSLWRHSGRRSLPCSHLSPNQSHHWEGTFAGPLSVPPGRQAGRPFLGRACMKCRTI